ncbi:MAG TPA: ABC transporter ATP-binding protein, partial [Myxococcota bacterium]|nr:ABC transporter ATP-binding protein [Myxococcota bacterium]
LLTGAALYPLRRRIAWVDPEIRLWSRTLIENLRYGADGDGLATVLEAAQLLPVLERLPEGMQTELGEGGCRLSGGEGQRLRLGRAMLRSSTGLALLDEPFRGLDRPNRQRLMAAARQLWAGSTLLCVTHDMQETLSFPRVLVIEDGVVKEDGDPTQLMQEDSRYRELVEAEQRLQAEQWGDRRWRRLRLKAGLLEGAAPAEEAR